MVVFHVLITDEMSQGGEAGVGRVDAMKTNWVRRGFTLVELLVVVSIIAILIALLLPSLAGARGLARTTVCGTNMRQMGVALSVYASDLGDYPAYIYDGMPLQSPTAQGITAYRASHVGCSMWEKMLPALKLSGYITSVKVGYCT